MASGGSRGPAKSRHGPPVRDGILIVQVAWIGRLALGGDAASIGLPLLGLAELAVPVWAERTGGHPTPWHAEHLTERYGLFTIIVLGECILAATAAVQAALAATGLTGELLLVALGGLILVCAMWWAYFKHASVIRLRRGTWQAYGWGYGHYLIFAAVAAVGAGLQTAVDATHQEAALSPVGGALAIGIPVIVYLATAGAIQAAGDRRRLATQLVIAAAVLVLACLGAASYGVLVAVLLIGIVVSALVAVSLALTRSPVERLERQPL